jgi:hypothetical protein
LHSLKKKMHPFLLDGLYDRVECGLREARRAADALYGADKWPTKISHMFEDIKTAASQEIFDEAFDSIDNLLETIRQEAAATTAAHATNEDGTLAVQGATTLVEALSLEPAPPS